MQNAMVHRTAVSLEVLVDMRGWPDHLVGITSAAPRRARAGRSPHWAT
jgi:hypothetical protein